MELYRTDIVKVGVNGVLLMCPGLMDGQLLVCMGDNSQKSVLLLAMASNPDLTKIKKLFQLLILEKFQQYIHVIEYYSFY